MSLKFSKIVKKYMKNDFVQVMVVIKGVPNFEVKSMELFLNVFIKRLAVQILDKKR